MTDPKATSAERCTSILLQDVMNYLNLPDILRAMGVNRLWRDYAINHPTYYGELRVLEEDPAGYTDLFLLRLSRSADRPISAFIGRYDPRLILAIATHLAQIRILTLQFHTSEPADHTRTASILESLCLPAPKLCRLFLHFMQYPAPPVAILPDNFLAGHAPVLERVSLMNVSFSSSIPEWLSTVELLSFSRSYSHEHELVLPNPFERCRNLRALHLQNNVTLAPEACRDSHAWGRISQVIFAGYPVASRWPALQLPIATVPEIILSHGDKASAVALTDSLVGVLEVSFEKLTRSTFTDSGSMGPAFFTAVLRRASGAGNNLRKVHDILADSGSISLFCEPSFTDRVVRLILPLVSWDEYVGLTVFGPFDTLDTLIITISADGDFSNPAPSKLSCPHLRNLFLKREEHEGEQPVVDVSTVANFALAALPNAKFPLRLQLDGIVPTGSLNGFPEAFSSCNVSDEAPGLRNTC